MRVTLMLSSSAFSGAESVVYYLLSNMAINFDIQLQLVVNQEIVKYYRNLEMKYDNIQIFCYGPHNIQFSNPIMKRLDKIFRLTKRYKQIFKINKPHLERNYKKRIIDKIRNFNPDFVHVHMYKTLETYLLIHDFVKKSGIKSCYTWHGNNMNRYRDLIIKKDFFDIYTAVSHDARMCWQSYFEKDIYTIYNGVNINVERVSKISYKNEGKVIILFPAGQREHKGYNYILKLNKFLLKHYPNFEIRICGGSRLKSINNIKYLGYMDHKDYLDELVKSDILVRPAEDDTFAISILEALVLNKRIVCSNLPVYQEVYGKQKNISYVDLNQNKFNAEVLNIIKKIEVSNPGENSPVFNINKKWLKKFSWSNIAKEYIELYKSELKEDEPKGN